MDELGVIFSFHLHASFLSQAVSFSNTASKNDFVKIFQRRGGRAERKHCQWVINHTFYGTMRFDVGVRDQNQQVPSGSPDDDDEEEETGLKPAGIRNSDVPREQASKRIDSFLDLIQTIKCPAVVSF